MSSGAAHTAAAPPLDLSPTTVRKCHALPVMEAGSAQKAPISSSATFTTNPMPHTTLRSVARSRR